MAGIYLHIPFCRQACTYCNFHFSTLVKNKDAVIAAMLKEIRLRSDFFPEKTEIETIYFGGGTPSLLSAGEINAFISTIGAHFAISENPEITLEANPDDLSEAYLQELKAATPVNRLSIGIQSFFEEDLQYMHRAHNAEEALQCLLRAQAAGFHELSIDLIYGTPTLSDEHWRQNLETVFRLQIPHISCYALTVEEKTALAHQIKTRKSTAPSDEQTARHFSILKEAMRSHGYLHYEISNFCKEGHFARHNTSYWKGISYLGIGPSAHSFDGTKRYWNIANNAAYTQQINDGNNAFEAETLSMTDRYNEYIMTSIRTMWGTRPDFIKVQFGEAACQYFRKNAIAFIEKGWLKMADDVYILTESGQLFCDHISAMLFISED